MNEERRIEALEHELKILKNEIHSTLLEIREQILNHYYPELRAEEPLTSLSLPVRQPKTRPGLPVKATPRSQSVTTTLSEIEAKGQVQPFSDIFLEDLDEDEESDEVAGSLQAQTVRFDDLDDDMDDISDDINYAADDDTSDGPESMGAAGEVKARKVIPAPRNNSGVTLQTREVDFRQLKQAAAAAAAPKTNATSERVDTKTQEANHPNFAALAKWVSDGVVKVGKTRAIQVLETYAAGGKLSDEIKQSLLQLISLASDEEPVTPAGSHEMIELMVGLDKISSQK